MPAAIDLDDRLLTALDRAAVESLNLTDFRALLRLHLYGPHTLGNLSAAIGHSTCAATGLADKLETLGLVERVRSKDDRRIIHIRLTEKASQLLHHIRTA